MTEQVFKQIREREEEVDRDIRRMKKEFQSYESEIRGKIKKEQDQLYKLKKSK